MVASIREQIIVALINAMTPAATTAGATIIRQSPFAVERDDNPFIAVTIGGDQVRERQNNRSVRVLTVTFSVVDRADAFTRADALVVAIHKAMMAQRNLGGLCQAIRETGGEWEIADADGGAVMIPATYEIDYRTVVDDISVLG